MSSSIPLTRHRHVTNSPSQIQNVIRAIGRTIMAIINAIGGIIMAIVNGIITILDTIVGFLTCNTCGGRRRHTRGWGRRRRTHTTATRV
jgi:hypothetical protein